MRPYTVSMAWGVMMLVIGAGAWVIGLTIHPGAHALQHIHRPQPIYYCSTDEMPLFEPCKEMKDQRDI
jgi:hypothetical protein